MESLLNALGSPVSDDSDMNGVPDECVITLCPNDLDGSGDVGFSDLLEMVKSMATLQEKMQQQLEAANYSS